MVREEVRDALGVSDECLKSIVKRKKLKDRLMEIGLELVCEYKQGRIVVYEVSPIELDYWDKVQNHYKVKKKTEHTLYSNARLDGGLKKSRATLLKESDIHISGDTARRYDDILENEGIIMKSDKVYMLYNKENDSFKEITEQEYIYFWREVKYCRELISSNRAKVNKYEISQDTYDFRVSKIVDMVGKEKGEIAIKFNTYEEVEDTKELLSLLKQKIGGHLS